MDRRAQNKRFRSKVDKLLISSMEVASPLAFAAAAGGSKRPLAYSPQLIESGSHEMDISDEPRFKRRRFHTDSMTDNISPKLSHYGPSFQSNKSIFAASQGKTLSWPLSSVDSVLAAT